MILLAVFSLIGGERLARREVEERTPIEKEKVLAFSKAFTKEVERIDELYLSHIEALAKGYTSHNDDETLANAREIKAVKSVYFLTQHRNKIAIFTSDRGDENLLPELELEGKSVLNRNKAVFIPRELFKPIHLNQSGWITSPDGRFLIRWVRPDSVRLIAVMVDKERLSDITNTHLTAWLSELSEPLKAESSHCELTHSSSLSLFQNGRREGEAGLVIPFYSSTEEWQLKAWEQVDVRSFYDSTTLGVAAGLAILLVICGVVLFQQQRRSLRLARQRVSFVNQVSHELGSPLTNVALNLDLAMESLGDKNTKARHRLQLIEQEVERLNRLVANVLTFSHDERGKLKLNKKLCVPNDILGDLLKSFQPALKRREIKVEYIEGENVWLHTDPDAFVQIVANLISNVEKYAYSGKSMLLTTAKRNDEFIVSVKDDGPGIPKDARQKIFQSCERVESRVNEGSSGAGLGLSIARSLAEKLGGSVELVSSETGCLFEFSLPIDAPISIESAEEKVG